MSVSPQKYMQMLWGLYIDRSWESFPDTSLCPGDIHDPKIQSLNVECPPRAQDLEHLVPVSSTILEGF